MDVAKRYNQVMQKEWRDKNREHYREYHREWQRKKREEDRANKSLIWKLSRGIVEGV